MWYNPMMVWLLKSPLHRIVSNSVMLITLTGVKSGKFISTPTNYLREGSTLWVISWRERRWWRNLRGGAIVRILLARKNLEGCGQVIEEEQTVAGSLMAYYQKAPQYAKYVGIGLDGTGAPVFADCERAAKKMVVVKIDLTLS